MKRRKVLLKLKTLKTGPLVSGHRAVSRFSYRRAENTAAALQRPGRRGRLLAEAQFAEDARGALRHGRRRTPLLLGWGGTPLGHGGRMGRGRRTQTSKEPGEELQSPSILLKAETLPLLHGRLVLPHCERCLCTWANRSLLAATVIILLPGGKISPFEATRCIICSIIMYNYSRF